MFFVGTSWKMNKTLAEARDYAARLVRADLHVPAEVELVLFPPFTALAVMQEVLGKASIRLGGQDVMWADAGAFTGEISPIMLKDVGCEFVEIGHSERRMLFGDTDERVNAKVIAVLRHGLHPLVCVGETAAERTAGAAAETVLRQARLAFAGVGPSDLARCRLAYEPVWAIGEGGTPARPETAAAIHAVLKDAFQEVPVIYGGSVGPDNAAALAARPEVDGLFVGRAALQADGFLAIVRTALEAAATKPNSRQALGARHVSRPHCR
jgi:triosephosphate isomerase